MFRRKFGGILPTRKYTATYREKKFEKAAENVGKKFNYISNLSCQLIFTTHEHVSAEKVLILQSL